MSSRSVVLAGLALVLVSALPASAGEPPPSTKHYPSTCGTVTLQLCVGGAVWGDTILIDTDAVIEEYVTINKNLHLGAAPGYEPTIDGGISVSADVANVDVTVQDLTVIGPVSAAFTGGGPHAVSFDRLHVTGGVNTTPISVFTTTAATVSIRSSTALGFADTVPGIVLHDQHDTGSVNASIVGNYASSPDATSGAGVAALLQGDGDTHAAIYNNVVWRAARWDGPNSAGILVRATNAGHSDVDIVGNTVDRVADDGLRVDNQLTALGSITLDIFDNLFTRTAGSGVDLQSVDPGTRTIRAGHNAFVDNGAPSDWDGASSGRVLTASISGYVDASSGDLRLKASSVLVDAGQVCTPGGLENLDASRNGRLAGPSVDIGAYERGAVAPTGDAVIGTSGPDTLVGASGADIVCGLGGNDMLEGGGGRDFLDGGGGSDQLYGDVGADRLLGGRGSDPCLDARDGVGGNDVVDGGKGTDGGSGDVGDTIVRVEGAAFCT